MTTLFGTVIATLALCAEPEIGQMSIIDSAVESEPSISDSSEETESEKWEFSAIISLYVVSDDREYVQPTFTADRGWLHLEARYNYEASETVSLWMGYNFGGGESVTWELTPMLGGVFGETTGVAPGYKAILSWWKLELYSEGEYVVDADDADDSYFYNWSELSVAPLEWLRFGVVAQRTRLYEGERDIQRGLLVGLSVENLDFTAYVFNPDDEPLLVFSIGMNF